MVSKKQQSATKGFYEMNIRVGSQEQIQSNIPFATLILDPLVLKNIQEVAISSINDNYTSIVYNFIKNGGQLTEKDICTFKGFDLEQLWNESETRGLPKYEGLVNPNFKDIKQYTRLTMVVDDPKVVHQIINLTSGEVKKNAVINSYDILAVRTSETEQLFEQCCTKSDVDIISLDLGKRLNYFITKTLVKQALERGIVFEICYGSGCFEGSQVNRKQFLSNCMQLIKIAKGKGIIISSETDKRIYQRSPTDAIQIGIMLGFNQDEAMKALQQNCEQVFKHSHMRKTYKGVAELVSKGTNFEEEKMQIS